MRFGIRELLYLLVLVGVMVGAYFVVLKPMDATIAAYKEDTANKHETLAKLEAAVAKYPDFDQEIARLTEANEIFEQRLPSRGEVEAILLEIHKIVSSEGLTTRQFVPDKTIKAAQYEEMPIKIEIEGDFDGYYNLIKRIEELPRITRMSEMSVQKVNNNASGEVRTELRLSIFFRNDDTPST
ncbi:MAG: type 4a pilus biogenesis protein PilO [Planctomycetota bacterium]